MTPRATSRLVRRRRHRMTVTAMNRALESDASEKLDPGANSRRETLTSQNSATQLMSLNENHEIRPRSGPFPVSVADFLPWRS